jgi:arylsulfatase A-like enzyme
MTTSNASFLIATWLMTGLLAACSEGEPPAATRAPEEKPHIATEFPTRPNIILLMSDDQGWGDTGFNGHPVIRTPNIDGLASRGMSFSRFYAAAPVCSPTRASVITGRHPKRMGIDNPNSGEMLPEEITIAEVAQSLGYRTAHFGKWHLGTMTHIVKDSNRGAAGNVDEYSPPWEHGYDVVFATEAKVPTFDPMDDPENRGNYYGTAYWTGPDRAVPYEDMSLWGDDSRVLMDRVIPFIEDSVTNGRRFFATIWLHSPHDPVVADPADDTYAHQAGLTDAQRTYYTIVTQMDRQIGRLWQTLEEQGIAENTLLAFTSDNGASDKFAGSNGALRGFKQDLYEGGIRVPGILVWPGKIPAGSSSDAPVITHDYLPTLLDIWQADESAFPSSRLLDGRSLMPLVRGETPAPRQLHFAFTRWDASDEFDLPQRMAVIDGSYKLISHDYGQNWELYDLASDLSEENDIAPDQGERVAQLRSDLLEWFESTRRSRDGVDYPD